VEGVDGMPVAGKWDLLGWDVICGRKKAYDTMNKAFIA
jgi:hypothetical protein